MSIRQSVERQMFLMELKSVTNLLVCRLTEKTHLYSVYEKLTWQSLHSAGCSKGPSVDLLLLYKQQLNFVDPLKRIVLKVSIADIFGPQKAIPLKENILPACSGGLQKLQAFTPFTFLLASK